MNYEIFGLFCFLAFCNNYVGAPIEFRNSAPMHTTCITIMYTCVYTSCTCRRHAAGLKERHARDVTTLRGEHNAALQSQEDRLNKQHQLDTDRGTDRDTGRGTDRGTD